MNRGLRVCLGKLIGLSLVFSSACSRENASNLDSQTSSPPLSWRIECTDPGAPNYKLFLGVQDNQEYVYFSPLGENYFRSNTLNMGKTLLKTLDGPSVVIQLAPDIWVAKIYTGFPDLNANKPFWVGNCKSI